MTIYYNRKKNKILNWIWIDYKNKNIPKVIKVQVLESKEVKKKKIWIINKIYKINPQIIRDKI